MYPSFQNKRYVIKVIIIYVLERKIADLKIRGLYASSKTFGKTEHFLAAVLNLRLILTLKAGKSVNTSYVCHSFLQFFIFL